MKQKEFTIDVFSSTKTPIRAVLYVQPKTTTKFLGRRKMVTGPLVKFFDRSNKEKPELISQFNLSTLQAIDNGYGMFLKGEESDKFLDPQVTQLVKNVVTTISDTATLV